VLPLVTRSLFCFCFCFCFLTYASFEIVENHLFKDDYLFYRFNDMTEYNASDTASELSEGESSVRQSLLQCNKVGLLTMGEIIRASVKVLYKYSVDKECFKCDEAVDFLVTSGLASTRLDAVQIGKALGECGFFHNVMDHGQKFQDARLFFSFEEEESDTWKGELQSVRAAFQSNVKVKDQTYHLKVYKDCFTGKYAVDCILTMGITTSRRDAVLLGRSLVYEYHLFAHVTDDHSLEDNEFFYRFSRGTRESRLELTSVEMSRED
jgi:hypothetical protein